MTFLKGLMWVAAIALSFFVAPVGLGSFAAHVLHGDNRLSNPELAHYFVVLGGLLPGLALPWLAALSKKEKIIASLCSLILTLPITFSQAFRPHAAFIVRACSLEP